MAKMKPSTSISKFVKGCNPTCSLACVSEWIIDSGASDHMTGNHNPLSDFNKHRSYDKVTVADGSVSQVIGSGTVNLSQSMSLSSIFQLSKSLVEDENLVDFMYLNLKSRNHKQGKKRSLSALFFDFQAQFFNWISSRDVKLKKNVGSAGFLFPN